MSETDYLQIARNKSTSDLIRDAAGYKPESHPGLAHRYVIEERKNAGASRRAWIAIAISALALVVSVLAFALK